MEGCGIGAADPTGRKRRAEEQSDEAEAAGVSVAGGEATGGVRGREEEQSEERMAVGANRRRRRRPNGARRRRLDARPRLIFTAFRARQIHRTRPMHLTYAPFQPPTASSASAVSPALLVSAATARIIVRLLLFRPQIQTVRSIRLATIIAPSPAAITR